nr:B3 domain-containing protein Os01g0234100-like [Ipomoea batatas]
MKLKVVLNQENLGDLDVPKEEIMEEEGAGRPGNEGNLSLATLPISEDPPAPSPGKRKRKAKGVMDEFSPLLFIRKRKKMPRPPGSQFNHEVDDYKGKSPGTANSRFRSSSALQVKSPTLICAEEVQSSLGQEHPTFLKLLVRSHVGSCFWMGFPVPFCKKHLSRTDTTLVLENESGEEFSVKYLAQKTGLSAGWRKFVAAHTLLEGDVLIFQLVSTERLKVYVIRANDLTEVDGALSLLNLEVLTKQSNAVEGATCNNKRRKHPKSLPLTAVEKKQQHEEGSTKQLALLEQHSGNDSDGVASEVLEDSKSSQLAVSFGDIKSFEDFTIVINNQCVDSGIPKHVRRKYYELCSSKNAFLHECLLPGLCCELVVGVIFELVSIADAIRTCKLTTTIKEFEKWDKSLRSFELLGMKTVFLRTHLQRLQSLALGSEGASDSKRYREAKAGLSRTEDEIRNLELKLAALKETSEKYGADAEALKLKAESHEEKFQGEVEAPW